MVLATMTIDTKSTLDPAEVEKFSKLAAEWWNPKGKMGVLHVFNPVRLTYIKEQVCARLGRDPFAREPFQRVCVRGSRASAGATTSRS